MSDQVVYWIDECAKLQERIEELEQERYNALYENAHLKHRIAELEETIKRLCEAADFPLYAWLEKDDE